MSGPRPRGQDPRREKGRTAPRTAPGFRRDLVAEKTPDRHDLPPPDPCLREKYASSLLKRNPQG